MPIPATISGGVKDNHLAISVHILGILVQKPSETNHNIIVG